MSIRPADNAFDPKYGYYCGRGNRCPNGGGNCTPCDAVDAICKTHDSCFTQCPGGACDIDEYTSLKASVGAARMRAAATDRGQAAKDFISSIFGGGSRGSGTPAATGLSRDEKRLNDIVACNKALCLSMKALPTLSGDAQEAKYWAWQVFSCDELTAEEPRPVSTPAPATPPTPGTPQPIGTPQPGTGPSLKPAKTGSCGDAYQKAMTLRWCRQQAAPLPEFCHCAD